MSRLGDMILSERTKKGLTARALAKKCGMSESYILEVESGRRILNDASAERIMKVLGAAAPPNETFHEPEQPREAVRPAAKKPEAAAPGEAWQQAFSSLLRAVPVLDVFDNKKGERLLPVDGGKIEGYPADRVFYLEAWEDSLARWRISRGDAIFVVPEKELLYGPILYLQLPGQRKLCRLNKLEGNRLALLMPDGAQTAQTIERDAVKVIGRCVRVEINL